MKVLKRPMFRYGGDVKKQGIMHKMNGLRNGGVATTMADATGMANGGIMRQGYENGLLVAPGVPNFYASNAPKKLEDMTLKEKLFRPAPNQISLGGLDRNDPQVKADLAAVGGDVVKYRKNKMEADKIAEEKFKSNFTPASISASFDTEEGPAGTINTETETEKFLKTEGGDRSDIKKPKVSKKETDAERIKRAYEILGVDDAKKDAVYNSLIDLSQAQAIDTKDISGSINRAIGALSKRSDKVDDLKDKAKAAVASGAIQEMFRDKETSADKKLRAYADATGKTKEYVARKELGLANSLQEAVSLLRKEKKGLPITSDDIVATAMAYGEEKGIPFKQRITTEQKRAKVGKGKDYETVVDLVQALELNPDGTDDGIYVVGTSIIQVEKGIAKLKG